jgi:gluconate 2-dehydrogenase gamma chain
MDEQDNQTPDAPTRDRRKGFSRLQFLKRSGAALGTVGLAGALASCDTARPPAIQQVLPIDDVDSMAEKYTDVPAPPTTPPPLGVYHVFTPEEAATVDALMSRLMPGSPDDPGAHEAGVVTYVDTALAWHEGNDQGTYIKPPFAMTYTGSTPPANDMVHGVRVIWVQESELVRYGAQSMYTPKETYRMSLPIIDRHAESTYGGKFTDLSPDQQDAIITDLAAGTVPGFKTKAACTGFFALLRNHMLEGMFSDPLYGGNRDMVGWKMIKYPGIHRAYTPAQILDERLNIPTQSMADLMPENPGQPSPPHNGILPISGSNQQQ